MTSTDLSWTFFGRKIKPFSFALSLTMLMLTWSILSKNTIGQTLDEEGQIVGVVTIAAFALLAVGFYTKHERWMRHGLLLAAGAWVSVSTVLWLEVGGGTSTLSASCWAIAAGGAWLLEKSDSRRVN